VIFPRANYHANRQESGTRLPAPSRATKTRVAQGEARSRRIYQREKLSHDNFVSIEELSQEGLERSQERLAESDTNDFSRVSTREGSPDLSHYRRLSCAISAIRQAESLSHNDDLRD